MNVLVHNCFHWISYHIVDQLLINGYQVDGYHQNMSEKAEFLSHFLGRNSLFTNLEKPQKKYDLVIILNDHKILPKIDSYQTIFLSSEDEDINENSTKAIFIKLPLLFGEWMNMNSEGIYVSDKYIPFASSEFQTHAVYIKDFTKKLLKYIKSIPLDNHILNNNH